MVQSIEFKNSNFQTRLSEDVTNIKKNRKLLIPAYKTSNLYELTTDEYSMFLTENISIAYEKFSLSIIHTINTEANARSKNR